MVNNVEDFIASLEGREHHAYLDTEGNWTTGIGHKIKRDESDLIKKVLTDDDIDELFKRDIAQAISDAKRLVNNFDELCVPRQAVIQSMAFNMGYDRLAGFRQMINAIENEDYNEAQQQILDSKMARQLPERAATLAHMMVTGVWQ